MVKHGRSKQSKHHQRVLHFMWSSAAPAARPRPRFKLKKLETPPQTKTRKHHRNTIYPNHFNSYAKMTPKWNQKWSQTGVCKCQPILLRNKAPMQVKQLFGETRLSKGTGSAFKDGGLQGDSLNADQSCVGYCSGLRPRLRRGRRPR